MRREGSPWQGAGTVLLKELADHFDSPRMLLLALLMVLAAAVPFYSAVDQLRTTVNALDPELAIADVRVMDQVASESVANRRFALFLVGLFAALALLLATIGMYGVISYSVNQRMHEFGIRMALGAKPSSLMRLIVGQGLRLFMIGAAIGLLSAAALSKLMGSLLYGVTGTDPITFAMVAVLTLVTTALACYLPARSAAGADPMLSIRSD